MRYACWKAVAILATSLGMASVAGATNLPIAATSFGDYHQDIIPDGAGGVYVSWTQTPDIASPAANLFVTRFDASGARMWSSDVLVTTAIGANGLGTMVPDGEGGVILVWLNGAAAISARRVDASGRLKWKDAVSIADGTLVPPAVVADENGGVLIIWSDRRTGTEQLYGQRITHGGGLAWGAGGKLLVPTSLPKGVWSRGSMVADGLGGAYLCYATFNYATVVTSLYLQHISSTGNALWAGGGTPIGPSPNTHQVGVLIPTGGALMMIWSEMRAGLDYAHADFDLYAMRFGVDGSPQWAQPQVVCNADQSQRSAVGIPDGSGGVFVAWDDFRAPRPGAFTLPHVFAQHLAADGTSLWAANGVHMGGALGEGLESQAAMVPSDRGGFWLAWTEAEQLAADALDIRAGEFLATGDPAPGTPQGGFLICDAAMDQSAPLMARLGSGVFVDWYDQRAGNIDLYGWFGNAAPKPAAQRLANEAVAPQQFRLALLETRALDAGRVAVTFELPRATAVTLLVHDVQGRAVGQLRLQGQPGRQTATLPLAARASSVYLVTLEAGGQRITHTTAIIH